MTLDEKKAVAAAWFRQLRDEICSEFEAIEAEYLAADGAASSASPLAGEATRLNERSEFSRSGEGVLSEADNLHAPSPNPLPQGERASTAAPLSSTFTRTPWSRADGGSGEMSLMKGRVFEKVGVNISVVHGEFSEQFRNEIPGAAENPTFWAAGISLVAHMASPLVPAAHMNTRMICVGEEVVTGAGRKPSPPAGEGLDGGAWGKAHPSNTPSPNPLPQGERASPAAPSRLWFGGGGDLNPMIENAQDTADFHAAFKAACDELNRVERNTTTHHSPLTTHDASYYEAFKAWCDEYFFIPHRNESRGVGGIFYDYLGLNRFGADTTPVTSGRFGKGGITAEKTFAGMQLAANADLDWAQGFEFTKNVGRTFASIYPELIRRHMFTPWTAEQRHQQLVKRGRYAEYNLLYDRGTRFGLMTGGHAEAILMSLPPVAVWE
jgi:coproporphyrinogen III oxidase